MNGEPVVTAKMAEALALIDLVGPLAVSNVTSRTDATVASPTARRLLRSGLVIDLAKDEQGRFVVGLSPEGEAFVEARRA